MLKYQKNKTMKNDINCPELREKLKNNEVFLIDVREAYEYENENIGGVNIPMSELPNRVSEIPKDRPVVIYCRSGARGYSVISFLEDNFGYTNLQNLSGGILTCD